MLHWARIVVCAIMLVAVCAHGALARPNPQQQRMDAARAAVEIDAQVQQVLTYRPGSIIGVEPGQVGSWTAWVRQPGDTRNLMTLTLVGNPPRIVSRQQLPFDKFPPRITQSRAITIARADRSARERAKPLGGMAGLRATAHCRTARPGRSASGKVRRYVFVLM